MHKLMILTSLFIPLNIANAQAANPCAPTPPVVVAPPVVPSVEFPSFLDSKFFQVSTKNAGGKDANQNAQIDLGSLVAKQGADDLISAAQNASISFETDSQGRKVEVRTNGTFTSRQVFRNGVQEVIASKDGRKRLHFVRNYNTGEFLGILIAASFDKFAPIASIIRPNGNGTSRQTFIIDIGNNKTNDLRADINVAPGTLQPLSFISFVQFNGGLQGQADSAGLVARFGGFSL